MSRRRREYVFLFGDVRYRLEVDSPLKRLISSEYYFTFFNPVECTVRRVEEGPTEHPVVLPYSYPNGLLRYWSFELRPAGRLHKGRLREQLEVLSEFSLQFPIILLHGEPRLRKLEAFIDVLSDFAEVDEMFFLVCLLSQRYDGKARRLLKQHGAVYYSSWNRVFLKVLRRVRRGDQRDMGRLLREEVPFDLILSISRLEDLELPKEAHVRSCDDLVTSFYDSYSDAEVWHGPNLWVDLPTSFPARHVLELHRRLSRLKLRKVYLDPTLHRFFNMLPVDACQWTPAHLLATEGGELYRRRGGALEYLGPLKPETLAEHLQAPPRCERDCGDLRLFCGGDPRDCSQARQVIRTFCEQSLEAVT